MGLIGFLLIVLQLTTIYGAVIRRPSELAQCSSRTCFLSELLDVSNTLILSSDDKKSEPFGMVCRSSSSEFDSPQMSEQCACPAKASDTSSMLSAELCLHLVSQKGECESSIRERLSFCDSSCQLLTASLADSEQNNALGDVQMEEELNGLCSSISCTVSCLGRMSNQKCQSAGKLFMTQLLAPLVYYGSSLQSSQQTQDQLPSACMNLADVDSVTSLVYGSEYSKEQMAMEPISGPTSNFVETHEPLPIQREGINQMIKNGRNPQNTLQVFYVPAFNLPSDLNSPSSNSNAKPISRNFGVSQKKTNQHGGTNSKNFDSGESVEFVAPKKNNNLESGESVDVIYMNGNGKTRNLKNSREVVNSHEHSKVAGGRIFMSHDPTSRAAST